MGNCFLGSGAVVPAFFPACGEGPYNHHQEDDLIHARADKMDAAPLKSLIACGTKLWLDSVDPDAVKLNRSWGATGATSNPIIIADLIKTGRFDDHLTKFVRPGLDDLGIDSQLTDLLR